MTHSEPAPAFAIEPESLHPSSFGEGFASTFRGMGLMLRTPKLLLLAFLAMLINGIVVGLLLWWGWSESNALLPFLKKYLGFAAWGFTIFKWVLLLALLYFVVPTVFSILLNLNPISAYLATLMFQIVFAKEMGEKLPETDSFMTNISKVVWTEFRKLLAMVGLMFVAVLFNFIPIVGSVFAAFLLIMINVQFSGWSYMAPYYEGLGYEYRRQRAAVARQNKAIWGIGVVAAIPFLNLLALFFGPIGGAVLAAKVHKKALDSMR